MKLYIGRIIFMLLALPITGILINSVHECNREKLYALDVNNPVHTQEPRRKNSYLRNTMDRAFLHSFKRRVAWQAKQYPKAFFLESLSNEKKIALTFDDGPHPGSTRQILQVLKKHNVHATFFMIGKKAAAFPTLTKLVSGAGHEIGSHSYNHKKILNLSGSVLYRVEVKKTQQLFEKITGQKLKLFRPPFGLITNKQIEYLSNKGIKIVNWSVDSFDWRPQFTTKKALVKHMLAYVHPGAIVLLHDAYNHNCHTHEALDEFIPRLKKLGYRFCTVGQLIID